MFICLCCLLCSDLVVLCVAACVLFVCEVCVAVCVVVIDLVLFSLCWCVCVAVSLSLRCCCFGLALL